QGIGPLQAWWVLAGALAVLVVVWMLGQQSDLMAHRAEREDHLSSLGPSARQALVPLPEAPVVPADKVALGERLFADKRLSADGTVACLSCHNLKSGGADGLRTAVGVQGRTGTVNSPTVFNAHLNFVQFWDGRARTLAEQAAGPIQNPLEMASNWPDVLAMLRADPVYVAQFQASYGGEVSARTVTDAIATFEQTLVTPNSRFDRYLRGQADALTAQELAGYRAFLALGCASCHQGAGIGGNLFQPFGIFLARPTTGPAAPSDQGRYNVTGRAADMGVFKVPSLRNVALTAPYFHDGSAATLEEAVWWMGRAQLGRDLASEDVATLTAFLRTLTGEWRGAG
ncbi:MAG: cytochrome-c peroxidase, partial [Burkholderiales bacterium]|nr:cytochrome-c peroxidase [Burkholderiales bacterium]